MSDPEAPDADAQEQALDADPTPVAPDAIEQAQPGPLEDDDAYER